MNFKNQLFSIIKENSLNIEILKTVKDLELDDCWIGAGFVRNTVWINYMKLKMQKLIMI